MVHSYNSAAAQLLYTLTLIGMLFFCNTVVKINCVICKIFKQRNA